MNKIFELISKYKSLISYAFFGVCTTVINVAVYYLCYDVMSVPNVASTIIAWVLAVIFAFVTNKLFVFDSKSFEPKLLIKEAYSFFGCRIATGVIDVIIMYVAVDLMHLAPTFWKILANIIVIVLNYVLSKLLVFNKKR